MRKIKDFFKRINEWIIKQAEKTDLEYKLNPSAELPDLIDLKEAHHNLLQGYVHALAALSRLSFFVNTYEVYKAKHQPSLGRLIYFIIGKFSPLRLLVIKPLLSLLVELHIKTKLREIETIYIQFPTTFPLYFDNKEKYLIWVKSAREECQELLGTLNTPRLLTSFMQSIFNILIALGITTAIINTITNLDWTSTKMIIQVAVLLFIPICYAYFFIDSSFRAKRDIFLEISNKEGNNIYLLENQLFLLFHRGKTPEFPLDNVGSIILAIPLLFYFWLGNTAVRDIAASNHQPNTYIVNIFPALIGITILFMFLALILPSIKRNNSGNR